MNRFRMYLDIIAGLIIGLLAAFFIKREQRSIASQQENSDWREGIYILSLKRIATRKMTVLALMIFFVAAGLFLRAFQVGSSSLWIDEGFTLAQVRAIQAHGYPLLASGRTEWKDALLPYLLSLIPVSDAVLWLRMVSVVFGTASIAVMYFLGKAVFGRRVAMLAAGMMAFSYWHIAWSRQIRSYSLLVFFLLLCLALLFRYRETERMKFLIASVLSGAAAVMSKLSGGLLFAVGAGYLLAKKRRAYSGASKAVLSIASVLMLIAGVWFWENFSQGVSFVSSFRYLGFYTIEYLWKSFGIVFALALVGGYIAWHKRPKHRAEHQALIALFFLSLAFMSFFVYVNQKRYLFFITPILFLYAAFLIEYGASLFKRKTLALVVLVGLCVGIDQLTVKSFLFTPKTFFALEAYTPQPDFKTAYAVLKETMLPEDVLVSAYPFMDQRYLGRADYALALSYTGREGDLSVTNEHKEYYSGAPEILSIAQFKKLSAQSDVYVLLDDMALDRVDPRYVDFIRNDAELFWGDKQPSGQGIFIYRWRRNVFEAM
ncbi:MAG: glycosyltransferase family 39 protein [Candidatus Moranbacteria bacterium]|nr:glycosyltransferase family 39 protein [Candidatus Moranbacteria bacterium]